MRRTPTALVVLALLTLPPAAAAQGRDAQIRSAIAAYDNFETDRALRLLQTALNPVLGPADSLWLRGAQFLVQMLFEENQPALAGTWARWAARLAPTGPLDTLVFISDVVTAFRTARSDAASDPVAERVVQTRWEWPGAPPAPTEAGRLRVLAAPGGPEMQILVVGRGLFTPGLARTLPAGSYTIDVSAQGFETARLTREVLPGVMTELTVALEPVGIAEVDALPDATRAVAMSRFVRLSVNRFGMDNVCAAGALVGRDGLVLTSYGAIRGARDVTATIGSGAAIRQGVVVLAHDAASDVAALALPGAPQDSLPLTPDVVPGQYVWALGTDAACGAPATTRRRVAERSPTGLQLDDSLAHPEGAILIDARGAVAGVPRAGSRAISAQQIAAVSAQARRSAAAGTSRSVVQIAERENHLYGAVDLSADVSGAQGTVTALETWHWPELRRSGTLPFRFVGPRGRYRLEVFVSGVRRDQREFVINPSVAERLAVQLQEAARPAQVAGAPGGGGGFPMPLAIGGGVAALGAVAFLVLGGGDNGGEQPPPPPTTGGITISLPNP